MHGSEHERASKELGVWSRVSLSSLCRGVHERDYVLGVHDHDVHERDYVPGVQDHDVHARDVPDEYEAEDPDVRHERGRALGASAPSGHAHRVSGHGEHVRRLSYQ